MKKLIIFLGGCLMAMGALAQSTLQKPLEISMQILIGGYLVPEGAFVPGPVQFFIHPEIQTTLPVHAGDTVMIDFLADGNKLTTAKAIWRDAVIPKAPPGRAHPDYMYPAQFLVPNYNWTNAPVGSHVLSIRAYGFHDLSASASIRFTVLPPLPIDPVSGTHTLTGKLHTPLKPGQVKLTHVPPQGKYEMIGTVTARAPGTTAKDEKDALEELKKQAAEMGANLVILNATHRSAGLPFSDTAKKTFVVPETRVSGQAVYAPSTGQW